MENMPCPKTLGWPACLSRHLVVVHGLKSPEAPAYLTRSVRPQLVRNDGSLVAHRHLFEEQLLLTHCVDPQSKSRQPQHLATVTCCVWTSHAPNKCSQWSIDQMFQACVPSTTTEARIIM